MKPQIKWALAAAAVLLVGLFSLQQTGALWRSEANSAGGTLTAGMLDISAGEGGVKQFVIDGMELTDADAGDSVQKPLPVINSGNVTMAYKLNSVAVNDLNGQGKIPMTVRVATVANSAACPTSGDVGTVLVDNLSPGSSSFAERNVAAGQTEVLCIRLTISPNAAASMKSNATFTFGASSVSGA